MKKPAREELITYAYILLYIALSSGQIFFNKAHSCDLYGIMSSSQLGIMFSKKDGILVRKDPKVNRFI